MTKRGGAEHTDAMTPRHQPRRHSAAASEGRTTTVSRKQKLWRLAQFYRKSRSEGSIAESDQHGVMGLCEADCFRRSHGSRSASTSSLSSTTTTSTAKDDSHVYFGHVHVREYEIVPGDNPAVSEAPAISLGWGYCCCPDGCECTVDEYEERRRIRKSSNSSSLATQRQQGSKDGVGSARKLTTSERWTLLHSRFKNTRKEIRQSCVDVQEAQRLRTITMELLARPCYGDDEEALVEALGL